MQSPNKSNSPLQVIKKAYNEAFDFTRDDALIVDFLISLYIANSHTCISEPLWGTIIGPPGSGKTETLTPFNEDPQTIFISSFTENALLSGYADENGNDPSLILLLDGKMLICKDFTALMNDNPTKVTKVMGDLRDAYDGYCAKPSGRAGLRTYKSKFGMLVGVTPVIDIFMENNQQLGERFVSFRLHRYHIPSEEAISQLVSINNGTRNKSLWRARLSETVQNQLDTVRNGGLKTLPVCPPEHHKVVATIAYLLANFRTNPVSGTPVDAEVGTRLCQQFIGIGHAHCIADGRDKWNTTDLDIIRRAAIDTLTVQKRRLLLCLYGSAHSHALSINHLSRIIRASSTTTIHSILNQYLYSKLIDTHTNGKEHTYYLTTPIYDLLHYTKLLEPGPHLPLLFEQSPTDRSG